MLFYRRQKNLLLTHRKHSAKTPSMITSNISWSLGATPNKSLDLLAVFICSHSPSDLITASGGSSPDSRLLYSAFLAGLYLVSQSDRHSWGNQLEAGLRKPIPIHLPGDPLASFTEALPAADACAASSNNQSSIINNQSAALSKPLNPITL